MEFPAKTEKYAVRLYSDNAQMTSKCGKSKEVRLVA